MQNRTQSNREKQEMKKSKNQYKTELKRIQKIQKKQRRYECRTELKADRKA